MDISGLLINVINGLLWGVILGAAATGLTLIWGVMKVVNIAHGETLLLGGYIVFVIYSAFQLSPYLGFIMSLLIGIVLGALTYLILLHKLIGHVEVITLKIEMSTLLVTFALSIIMYNLYYFFFGGEPRGLGTWNIGVASSYISLGFMNIRVNSIFAVILSVILVLVLHLFLTRTIVGKSILAVMQDSLAASLVGINPVKIKFLTTIMAFGVTAFSGVMILLHETAIVPDMAYKYAPIGFVTVVVGGLGSVLGSFLGGILIGLVYGFSRYIFSSVLNLRYPDPLALAVVFVILILALLFKPQGLFGGGRR